MLIIKINKSFIYLAVILTILGYSTELCAQRSRGVVANTKLINLYQPDGSNLNLYIKGDAVLNWYETTSGEKVLKDANNWFVYAYNDSNGNMMPSENKLGIKRSLISSIFSKDEIKGNKDVFFNQKQITEKENSYFNKSTARNSDVIKASARIKKLYTFPSTGKRKMLTILAEFSDTPHKLNQSIFYRMMNEAGYDNTGSFRDYYLESSYGTLDIKSTVTLWVKVPHPKAYYGRNDNLGDDSRPREFIQDAVQAAMNTNINFADFDNDKDGYVDFLQVIHSGVGEEGGEDSDAIWSHQWELNGYIETKDGIKIRSYFTAPELYTKRSNEPSSIGVVCHEFGHALGLVDYYDTDYAKSGGYADGLGNWDLMDSGCWNNEGKSPSQNNVYSKHLLGWVNIKELNTDGIVNLNDLENNKEGYILRTNKDSEFFIIENRQKKGFDRYIPHHGMLVYHVDRSNEGWTNNKVNINPDKEGFRLMRAKSYSKNCPFPGEGDVMHLSDQSTPCSLKTYDNEYSYKSLLNIKEYNGVISFQYINDSRLYKKLEINVSSDNIAIENAQINLISQNSSAITLEPKTTNFNGQLLFDFIAIGSYKLIISRNGFTTKEENISLSDNLVLNSEIIRNKTIKIIVTNNNKALENIKIDLKNKDIANENSLKQITNNNGEVYFENFVFGNYTISAENQNYSKYSKAFSILDEKDINIDLKEYSIKNISDKLKLYPNPTHGEVQLEIELSDEAIVVLVDLKGNKVYEKAFTEGMLHSLDLSFLSAGIYNLIIIDKESKYSKRLIIN